MNLEVLTFTHPRRSSDYCLEVEASDFGCPARIYAACDMIGRPSVLYWGNYMRRVERDLQAAVDAERPRDLDGLLRIVRRVLRHHNELVRAIRTRHDRSAFGFCLALAAIYGEETRIHWLGDCRAYEVRNGVFRHLTQDQNKLHVAVMKSGDEPLVLFRSEIQELSRHLEGFLGMYDEAAMDALLDAQSAGIALQPGAALLLASDGLYMPMVRERMEATNYRLTAEELYAEKTMAAVWAQGDRLPAGDEAERWMNRASALVSRAVENGRRRPRYRDDIAMLLAYVPDARGRG